MEVPGKRIETDEGGNAEEGEQFCEPCEGDNITTRANGICRECGEYMCNTCFTHHLRGKPCRHHVLVDVNLSSASFLSVERCNRHNGETIKFYCRKHEVVGCGDCMVLEHNSCSSEYIKNLSNNFEQSNEFKTFVSNIEKLTSVNKEIEDTLQDNKNDNEIMLENTLRDIRKFRIDINKYLDKVEADVISEAKHVMSDNDKVLTKLEEDCRLLSSQIDKMKQMLNTRVFQGNTLFINTVVAKPHVSDIERTIAQLKSKNVKSFEFVSDEQIRSIVSSTKKLGTLNITATVLQSKTKQQKRNTRQKREGNSGMTTTRTEKDTSSDQNIVAGVRVQDKTSKWGPRNGTVTAVQADGTVSVKWDHTGYGGPYTIGEGRGELCLI